MVLECRFPVTGEGIVCVEAVKFSEGQRSQLSDAAKSNRRTGRVNVQAIGSQVCRQKLVCLVHVFCV